MLFIVGEDFSTFTGEEVITAVLGKGNTVAMVDVLIRDDTVIEGTECFTAELHSELLPSDISLLRNSTVVYIEDTHTVLYNFQQRNFSVYESNGHATVRLISSSSIPSDVTIDVDVIDGIGSAFGE